MINLNKYMVEPKDKFISVLVDFDNAFNISQKKIMIKPSYTVGMIMQKIRLKWISEIDSKKAMFLFFKDLKNNSYILQPVNKSLSTISNEMNNPSIIQIFVKLENTFGYF
jgi:hypothetical protein|tara:strand:- start:3019 stop:3348 length:330 start_codon:yes stop_codon:yes gene_type:complete